LLGPFVYPITSALSPTCQSLFRCKTAMGSRLLARWLRRPLRNALELRSRQNIVGALLADAAGRALLHSEQVPSLCMLECKVWRLGACRYYCASYKLSLVESVPSSIWLFATGEISAGSRAAERPLCTGRRGARRSRRSVSRSGACRSGKLFGWLPAFLAVGYISCGTSGLCIYSLANMITCLWRPLAIVHCFCFYSLRVQSTMWQRLQKHTVGSRRRVSNNFLWCVLFLSVVAAEQ
jgi:hypothetical protein